MSGIDDTEAEQLVSLFRAMTEAKAAADVTSTDTSRTAAEMAVARFDGAARLAMKRIREQISH